MKTLLSILREKNIHLKLEKGELSVRFPKGEMDVALLSEIKDKKAELISYLTGLGKNEAIPILPTQDSYVLSSAQKRLWILSQLEEHSVAYNISGVYLLEGDLSVNSLETAFGALTDRHEILRTIFREEGGVVKQVIEPGTGQSYSIPCTDLRYAVNVDGILASLLEKASQEPFNLSTEKLLRLHLYRLSDNKWVLGYVMHHIISDGWSMGILISELLQLYNAHLTGTVASLSPLRIQYKDYAAWQQQQLSGEQLTVHRDYWLQQMEGPLPVLDLPGDHMRPALKTYNGHWVESYLEEDTINKLRGLCQEQGATLFMGLLALVNTLLYRYTGQDDLILGTPVAGREHADLEDQIGFYVNTLALRTRLKGDMSYRELLGVAKQVSLDAYAHQVFPFDELVELLDLPRDMSRSTLFDAMIVLQNNTVNEQTETDNLGGLKVSSYQGQELKVSKYDLIFHFVTAGAGLVLGIEYNTDIYERSTTDRFITHLRRLLAAICLSPDAPLHSLEILDNSERAALLAVDAADYPRDKTVIQLFEEQVARTPDNIALVFGERTMSYRELNGKANKLGAYLRGHYHISADDLIAVQLNRSPEMIIALLAVLKSGGAYVPIDPDYPAERISYMRSDSNSKLVIDAAAFEELCTAADGYSGEDLVGINRPEDLIYVIYTSGTTGRPKGSLITHANVVRLFKTNKPLFDFNESDVWTLFHSYCFDFSVWEMYGALLHGGKLVILSEHTVKDVPQLLSVLTQEGVTVLNQTPGSFYQLLQAGLSAQQLRYVIFGGEALSPSRLLDWRLRYPKVQLINMYGITETTVHVTYKLLSREDMEKGLSNIGKPIPTLSAYVLDGHGQLVPTGIAGELYVGGAGVGRGYLNRPDLTAARFMEMDAIPGQRLYKTGDRVRLLDNGELEYFGRLDAQVKIRGHRVELGEVAHILNGHPEIRSAVATVRVDASGEQEIVGYITGDREFTTQELRAYVQGLLPVYMCPAHFVQLESIPLTSNGKTDYKQLPEVANVQIRSGRVYIAPRNVIEEQLVAIWGSILGKGGIGVKDDFFESGGNSLKATRLSGHIYKELGVKVGIKELFIHSVLEAQALLIREGLQETYAQIPVASVRSGYPLSSSQHRLWTLSQLEGGNTAYHIPGIYILEGDLDTTVLTKSLHTLITRHEILRTVFREDASGAVQQFIHKDVAASGFDMVTRDLRGEVITENEMEKLIRSVTTLPFDLSAGPLLRVHLYHIAESRWILIYVMHHIISDGWSMGILIRELLQVYNARIKGADTPLTDLRIQYKDYAVWQQEQLSGEQLEEHQRYWLGQFAGRLPVLQLPSDKQRPAIRTYNGGELKKQFSVPLSGRLNELCREEGATLFMGLLAAVNVLLYRYSHQEDLIVGSPIAGRHHADLEDQIGFYINTLAFRTRLKGSDAFSELLENVKQVTLGAYEHQVYPFDTLIDQLQLKRDLSRNALFDVMILLQNHHTGEHQQLGDITVKPYDGGRHFISKYDLTFYFEEIGPQLQTVIEYSTDLFNERTIRQLGEHLEKLLTVIVEHPLTTTIDQLLYLADKPQYKLPLTLQERNDEGNCTEHQKRLWFIDQFEKNYLYTESPVYHNLPLVINLNDEIDIAILDARIQTVLATIPLLRTNIITRQGAPFRQINEQEFAGIRLHTANSFPDENELRDIIDQPFDISRSPLIRFDLIQHPEGSVLIITAHHIIADRQSLHLMANYLISGIPKEENVLYGAYAEWQQGLKQEATAPLSAYWKRKLFHAPVLYMETDWPRKHIHVYEGSLLSNTLTADLSSRISAFCAARRISPFDFFLTAFNTLLYRYTGADEIVTGTIYENRDREALKNMIGPIANLITLKAIIKEHITFAELLEQVTLDHQNAASAADVPFENVVLDVNPEKDMSRTALFDILLHYEEITTQPGIETIELNYGLGKYDINLLIKKEEGFGLYLTYNNRYFRKTTITRFLRHYTALLEAVLDTPERPVYQLDYLSAKDKQELLTGLNDAAVSYPREQTLLHLLNEQASRTPDNIALVFGSEQLSYSELHAHANQLGHYLRDKYKVQPDDLVAIKLGRSVQMLVAVLGILQSGAAYVPVDPEYPQQRIDYMLHTCRCKVVIDKTELEQFESVRQSYATTAPDIVCRPDHLAYVIFTSGTTGNPKGSLITHRNVVRLFKTDKPLFDFSEKDVWTLFHSYCFDFSVWEMYGALLFGGKLVVVPAMTAKDPAAFTILLEREGVTVLNQTPSAFYHLINHTLEKNASLALRYVIFGGEALNPVRLREWHAAYPAVQLINMYGITETTVHVTYKALNAEDLEHQSSNIGRPIPTLSCYVLDQHQQLLPPGMPGELYVGGAGVARGYLNQPELTAQRFIDSPFTPGEKLYRSGDKVKILENGELEYGGRIDDQVKVRGYRIELGEIENVLQSHPQIKAAVVIARNGKDGDKELVAYLTGAPTLDVTEVRHHLNHALPVYMHPQYLVQVDSFPVTSNGKIDKKRLPEPGDVDIRSAVEYVAPRNETESRLKEIWKEILDRESISIKDNFFELGGHSLKATRLVSQIRKVFDVNLTLVMLFSNPTIEGIAAEIEKIYWASNEAMEMDNMETFSV